MSDALKFSSSAKSRFLRWSPTREDMEKDYQILRLFIEPVTQEDKGKLLTKWGRVPPDHGELMLALSHWSPDSKTAVKLVLDAVFKQDPQRVWGESQQLEDWSYNVDNLKTDLSSYVRKATQSTLVYGVSYTLLGLPRKPDGLYVNSLADERPYLSPLLRLFSAPELVYPDINPATGELERVLFYCKDVAESQRVHHWYEADTASYREWVLPDGKDPESVEPQLYAEASHNFGFVPVVPSYFEMCEPMFGCSYLQDSAGLDIRKFLQETDKEYDRYLSCHPQRIIKSDAGTVKDDRGNTTVEGANPYGTVRVDASASMLMGKDDDTFYLTIPQDVFEVTSEAIKQTRMDICRALRIDPLGFIIQEGKIEISGIARQLNHAQQQADTLTAVAEVAEEAESNLIQMAYTIMENKEPGENVNSAYVKDFSLTAIDTQMKVYMEIKDLIASPTFHKTIATRFAKTLIGNMPQINEQVEKEIEAAEGPKPPEEDAQQKPGNEGAPDGGSSTNE